VAKRRSRRIEQVKTHHTNSDTLVRKALRIAETLRQGRSEAAEHLELKVVATDAQIVMTYAVLEANTDVEEIKRLGRALEEMEEFATELPVEARANLHNAVNMYNAYSNKTAGNA
jgi:hypothetical protein